jgi:hypothetical protein
MAAKDQTASKASRADGRIWNKEKWPLAGPFLYRASLVVVAMLDDHLSVSVAMASAFVPAVIPHSQRRHGAERLNSRAPSARAASSVQLAPVLPAKGPFRGARAAASTVGLMRV